MGNQDRNDMADARNDAEGVEEIRAAAEQGSADAQFEMGSLHFEGKGVEQDYAKAIEWWEKAAEQGHDEAKLAIGQCHRRGLGVDADLDKAIECYIEVAAKGDPQVQFVLGTLYVEKGIDSYGDAIRWFSKAAKQGHERAQEQVEACRKRLRLQQAMMLMALMGEGPLPKEGNGEPAEIDKLAQMLDEEGIPYTLDKGFLGRQLCCFASDGLRVISVIDYGYGRGKGLLEAMGLVWDATGNLHAAEIFEVVKDYWDTYQRGESVDEDTVDEDTDETVDEGDNEA